MAQETQKEAVSTVVRIWAEPKKRLQRLVEAKTKKERRPVTEAEIVSRAVEQLCDKEERKLGLV